MANTGEPLYVVNWSGERPIHEGAAADLDRAATVRRQAGFGRITFRSGTDFSQTADLDLWSGENIRFLFGDAAATGRKRRADEVQESAWKTLPYGQDR